MVTSDFSGPPALLTWASVDRGGEFMGTGMFVAVVLFPHIYPEAGVGAWELVIQFTGF